MVLPSTTMPLLSVRGESVDQREDAVATEEPLEIRAQGPGHEAAQIAVTMRTPGHDAELAIGFLLTEGVIHHRDELGKPAVRELAVAGGPGNIATVRLLKAFDIERLKRNFYATSSCGICGKASIDHLDSGAGRIESAATAGKSTILRLPEVLRAAQATFERTGGLHATGAFNLRGELLALREDVGRHNAMDKVIGRLFLDGQLPFSAGIFLVSGRASFELVQKAAMAGVPILCAVSAPSSLAVQAAERLGMTLVGFLREGGFNVYAHPSRIELGG